MLFRAIILSLALVFGIGTTITLMTASVEAHATRKTKKLKKYSKTWWLSYHRKEQKNNAILSRKRALRARQILLARQKEDLNVGQINTAKDSKVNGYQKAINNQEGSIGGTISDGLGGTVPGVLVTITDSNGAERKTITNKQGEFAFKNVTLGKYILKVNAPKFSPYTNSEVEVIANESLK